MLHSSARRRSPVINPSRATVIKNVIALKETLQISNTGHIPTTEVLIEWIGSKKHIGHIRYLTSVPVANRLIKCSAIPEHVCHGSNRTSIPTANTRRTAVVKSIVIMVSEKHLLHCSNIRHIPVPDILVKSHSSLISFKHIRHISHRTCIPVTNRLIKPSNIYKHLMHSNSITCIPRIHISFTTKLCSMKHKITIITLKSKTISGCYI